MQDEISTVGRGLAPAALFGDMRLLRAVGDACPYGLGGTPRCTAVFFCCGQSGTPAPNGLGGTPHCTAVCHCCGLSWAPAPTGWVARPEDKQNISADSLGKGPELLR